MKLAGRHEDRMLPPAAEEGQAQPLVDKDINDIISEHIKMDIVYGIALRGRGVGQRCACAAENERERRGVAASRISSA